MLFPSYVDRMTPTAATELAEAVVEDGFGSHRAALASLFDDARRHGVSETLVAIADDPSEPRPVRERALGMVVVRYVRAYDAAPDPRSDRAGHRVGDRVSECIAA